MTNKNNEVKITFLPKTSHGKKSMWFLATFAALMALSSVLSVVFQDRMGDIVSMDSTMRPLVIAGGLMSLLAGLVAFVFAALATTRQKERALLLVLPILVGFLILMFVFGEIFIPH